MVKSKVFSDADFFYSKQQQAIKQSLQQAKPYIDKTVRLQVASNPTLTEAQHLDIASQQYIYSNNKKGF